MNFDIKGAVPKELKQAMDLQDQTFEPPVEIAPVRVEAKPEVKAEAKPAVKTEAPK